MAEALRLTWSPSMQVSHQRAWQDEANREQSIGPSLRASPYPRATAVHWPSETFRSGFTATSVACFRLLLCCGCRMSTVRSSPCASSSLHLVPLPLGVVDLLDVHALLPVSFGSQGAKPVAQLLQKCLGLWARSAIHCLRIDLHTDAGHFFRCGGIHLRARPQVLTGCLGSELCNELLRFLHLLGRLCGS